MTSTKRRGNGRIADGACDQWPAIPLSAGWREPTSPDLIAERSAAGAVRRAIGHTFTLDSGRIPGQPDEALRLRGDA